MRELPGFAPYTRGVKATIPLVVGAVPFGIIFGAAAVNSGLSAGATAAMSAFVFAGSAQFIAAGLVASGAGALIIILTTLVVNLRHSLYSITLAPHMKHLPQRWLVPLGFWLTDESFLVVAERYNEPDASPYKHWFFLGSAVFMYTNWQLCTWIGIFAGQRLPDPASWGLDFALVVTFIGMVAPGLRSRPLVASVVTAGLAAILLAGLPNRLGLIAAALAGIAAGMAAERLAPAPVATAIR
ncbi:MAG TPA: AzlC family ABC transporter permease [Caldilinea sp.]|nr:AzlC family ABC transporter permease [Caldilinea sp.]